ncbi:TonB-dependent siderophore receptor [Novosphingobium sp. 1949]|uniref:TonB-dependent siderophore receptor n=1 Tax=Novosphingobium organovorum TaxID=2930092 RepID=A0ABT0BCG5_9SPHN|nr:TonB-dependent siderophore receptor [Novosphingobium organovorum]MCJ2182565.1 TonB-dependent siderophore receptor [Novosphingobium organovorum]
MKISTQPHGRRSARRTSLSLCALACALSATTAIADEAHDADTNSTTRNRTQEIIVTGSYTSDDALASGTGLGLTIAQTPQSVTVITTQRIEDQGLHTLTDVVNNAAGISAQAYDSSRNGFSARGFTISDYQVDGIPVQWDIGFSAGESLLDLAIYDHVEIVRGATGLMTGAGNPSASINLIRKHATSRELTGSVSGSYGSWNRWSLTGDLSTPVTSNGAVRARVVARYAQGDSFVDYLHNKTGVLYGVVDADLSPTTLISIGASFQKNDPSGSQWGGLPVWYSDGTRTNWRRSKTTAAKWASWQSTNTTQFLNLTQQLGANWTIRGYVNHTQNKGKLRLLYLSGTVDRDTGEGLSPLASRYQSKADQIDAGLRLNGTFALLGREHELTLGASYARQDFDYYSFAKGTVASVGDFFEWDGSFAEPEWGARSQVVDRTTKQWGYYAATRLSLADPIHVVLGARLSSWTRKGSYYGSTQDYGDHDRLLPYAGVLYDIVPGHTLYASYTKIFNPQNYQDLNGDFLPPVTGVNYEAGLKSRFFAGALTTSLAVFRIEQDNLGQVDPDNIVPGTTNQAYTAAQGAHSKGFEIEANGRILPGWEVSASYTGFKARDADGSRINTLSPQRLARLFTTYTFQDGLDGLAVGGGVSWQGFTYTDATNPVTSETERLGNPAYALVNLMARYRLDNGLSAQVNVANLFDKTYYSQIGFYSQYAYGEPRSVTVTLRYGF